MKKLLAIATLISSAMLISCDNDNSVNPQPLGKATITGTVYADFDYTNNSPNTTYDKVANKKLTVLVWDDNYYGSNGGYKVIESTTDSNGNYSIEIPVANRELEVTIKVVDFKQAVKYSDREQEQIFRGDYFYVNTEVNKGDELIRDIYYYN